jgi:hypothetical protein
MASTRRALRAARSDGHLADPSRAASDGHQRPGSHDHQLAVAVTLRPRRCRSGARGRAQPRSPCARSGGRDRGSRRLRVAGLPRLEPFECRWLRAPVARHERLSFRLLRAAWLSTRRNVPGGHLPRASSNRAATRASVSTADSEAEWRSSGKLGDQDRMRQHDAPGAYDGRVADVGAARVTPDHA